MNLQVTIMKQLSFIHAHLRLALVCLLLGATTMLMAASRFVSFQTGDLQLTGGQITISYDVADAKAVAIAAQTLSQDFQRVTGSPAQLTQNDRGNILVGTLGQSALIDRLVKQHKLDASLLKGKREKFVITLIGNQCEHIAIIFINNAIYGMTGGQMAPTTLMGMKTSTCPYGRQADLHGYL